ncbi:MAG TPA: M15 family metallopeptidase [Kofleriaceae bacterium]|nr:M15 family metallopeptidase [Kofleriaceae bacterium]
MKRTQIARFSLHSALGALTLVAGCASAETGNVDGDGVDDGSATEVQITPNATATVQSFVTSTGCSTAVVLGLSKQIAQEISCLNPSSLTQFAAGSGITITSNAVLPFLAANAKTDLQAVGSVQVNSAFRTIAAQYLLLQWFNRGMCGITAAAAVGRSNHESGRAVDLANWSSRISAMSAHHWSHDVAGDNVHFDHLTSADIRGKDVLAFQRLWNRNHPTDKISEDGIYGPMTETRLKESPAAGFATGASCLAFAAEPAEIVSVDGPDKIAPQTRNHYRITISNTTATAWPAGTKIVASDLNGERAASRVSAFYDQATWTAPNQVGVLAQAIPAGGTGVVELDVAAPEVDASVSINTHLTLTDGTRTFGTVPFAAKITVDGDEGTSTETDEE